MLAKMFFTQFAYLQLGTILATALRQVEVRLDQSLPEHNYHVRVPLVSVMTHAQFFYYLDHDHDAQEAA